MSSRLRASSRSWEKTESAFQNFLIRKKILYELRDKFNDIQVLILLLIYWDQNSLYRFKYEISDSLNSALNFILREFSNTASSSIDSNLSRIEISQHSLANVVTRFVIENLMNSTKSTKLNENKNKRWNSKLLKLTKFIYQWDKTEIKIKRNQNSTYCDSNQRSLWL